MAIAYYIPDQAKLAEKHKPKVVKKVKIPLNDYSLGNNSCWDLMAQVFCYALRYHNLTAGSGSLQISLEFSQPQQEQPANVSSEAMMTDDDHQDLDQEKDDGDGCKN